MKDINICANVVTIKSVMNTQNQEQMAELAKELLN